MYVGKDFDVADFGENEVYSFDFINDLISGDAIVSAAWTLAAIRGTDADPASHLVGPTGIDGPIVSMRLTGLLASVVYRLQCAATTADGEVISLWSHVSCQSPD